MEHEVNERTQGARWMTFLMIALVVLVVQNWLMKKFMPPPPAKAPEGQKELAAGEQAKTNDKAPAKLAIDVPKLDVSEQYFTLGSADPASGYRMLVTLTNRGAAVERIELNSPRYRDATHREATRGENHGGWLGSLALGKVAEGNGGLVRAVGPGTPAALSGLAVGDIITRAGDSDIVVPGDLDNALLNTRPGHQLALSVKRGGETKELAVKLIDRPLSVVQPEADDPLSFLLTIDKLDDRKIGGNDDELAGVTMRTANWQAQADADAVAFTWPLGNGLEVVKRYRLAKAPESSLDDPNFPAYHVELDIELRNTGSEAHTLAYRLDGPTGLPVEGWWYATKISPHWFGAVGVRDVVAGHWQGMYRLDTSLISCNTIIERHLAGEGPRAIDPEKSELPATFVGVDALYFASALVPQLKMEQSGKENWFENTLAVPVGKVPEDKGLQRLTNVTCRLISKPLELAPGGEPLVHRYQVFAGPKRPTLLQQYDMADLIYYGWFGFTAKPLLWVMHLAHDYIFHNYALAIILLTVVVRSAMFPISRKQVLNAQKMQELQPELQKIKEKHKADMQAMSKAQQELFAKHKFNPAAGCLPVFLQLPIFIGLYRSLALDVELRQSALIPGVDWASNLCAPDMMWYWEDHLWPSLANPNGWFGPYFNLLPLLTMILFLVQQKMLMPPATDEQSRLNQKVMQYMTIFMGFMFFKVAAGLCIYFIASSMWSLAERKLLPKTTPTQQPAIVDVRVKKKARR